MKVKVVSVFRDKNTKEIYSLGEVIDVSNARYKEIKPYVEIIKKK